MADQLDEAFYTRADEYIYVANGQAEDAPHAMVNASFMFAAARFSAFTAARGFESGEGMKAKRDEMIEYFMTGFRQMLEGNVDAYVQNFDAYMRGGEKD